ncbi:unnamed protein product [Arctia plantaginis]|uniref:Uncharacterized protein n=1 Tax=Arctia plantaginis TaxID=874455 RepID=A0A8S1BI59_ARCPL|nr:unnamed protein product [Arctia plantaginis]
MSDKVVYSEKKGIKTSFCNRKRPKISRRRPLNRLLEIGLNSYEMCLEIDKQSIKLAERSLSDRVKEARIASRSSRKEMQEH